MSPLPWYVSEIQESGDIKYLIRSEDHNQFPTWIAELSNHEDGGLSNGKAIVNSVNNYGPLFSSCEISIGRIEWAVDLMRRTGSALLQTSAQATIQGAMLIREAKLLAESLGPIVKAVADAKWLLVAHPIKPAQLAQIASAAPLTPDQLDRLVKRGEK